MFWCVASLIYHNFNENTIIGGRMMGLPLTFVSSIGQKNFVFFCGFYAFLQVKGRFYIPQSESLS
jgi:hypothetical protein